MASSASLALATKILNEIRQDDEGQDDWESCGREFNVTLQACMTQLDSPGLSQSQSMRDDLFRILSCAKENIQSVHHSKVQRKWRRLYTDVCILGGILTLLESREEQGRQEKVSKAIQDLDMAIIICGAPGLNRLEIIYQVIAALQLELPSESTHSCGEEKYNTEQKEPFCLAFDSIREMAEVPTLSEYLKLSHTEPFIVRRFADDWPALRDDNRRWSDARYLAQLAGPGRVVPVEIGSQYTESDWYQDIISWQDFLRSIGWSRHSATDPDSQVTTFDGDNNNDTTNNNNNDTPKPKYLAQHNLFTQFPHLEADIILPDIIYSCPSAPSYYPNYKAPLDEDGVERVIVNAWLGPKGTTTPAHFDPYFNAYVQVVGYKLVWLSPPDCLSRQGVDILLDGNSSTLPIFEEERAATMPKEADVVYKEAKKAILGPGDLLVLPPAWFHAMRSMTKVSSSM